MTAAELAQQRDELRLQVRAIQDRMRAMKEAGVADDDEARHEAIVAMSSINVALATNASQRFSLEHPDCGCADHVARDPRIAGARLSLRNAERNLAHVRRLREPNIRTKIIHATANALLRNLRARAVMSAAEASLEEHLTEFLSL